MSDPESVVFVVDDELDARRSISALITSLGVKCETFSSGETFLDRFSPSMAGCVLADLVMDGIDGIELQERLAEMGSTLPVILISAFADVPVAVRAMRKGALTVLEKPYRANELCEAIQEAFEQNRRLRSAIGTRGELRRRVDTLTDRERRVMRLMLKDTPNRVIADKLQVGRRTVDRVWSAILEKMAAQSLVELAQQIGALRALEEADSNNSVLV